MSQCKSLYDGYCHCHCVSLFLVSLKGQGVGEAWGSSACATPAPESEHLEAALIFWARQVGAPFLSLSSFSSITLHSASNYIPRVGSKVPSSRLPLGGSRERVRLVNLAGVSRGWEGILGTEAQRSHITEGPWNRAPHGSSHPQLPHLLWMPLWTFALILPASLSPMPTSCCRPSPGLIMEIAAI